MSEFMVFFEGMAGLTIRVEADDPDDAVNKAYDEMPGGVCAQCSGWGKEWSLDVPDEWDVCLIEDGAGKDVTRK